MVCTFFGHRNAPEKIKKHLQSTIIDLIKNKNVDTFYVGNNGSFDYMVENVLEELKKVFPHIKFTIVLAYMPVNKNEYNDKDYSNTIYLDELAYTLPKFSIIKRNEWMLKESDYVITYVKQSFGGAAKFKKLAEKKNKIVINLVDEK